MLYHAIYVICYIISSPNKPARPKKDAHYSLGMRRLCIAIRTIRYQKVCGEYTHFKCTIPNVHVTQMYT